VIVLNQLARPAAIAIGFGVDRAFGEPPVAVHPVVGFGALMKRVEQAIYKDTRPAGVAMLTAGVGATTLASYLATRLVGRYVGRHVATALAVATSVAGKMLADEARCVGDLLERNDLGGARVRVISLVGRSTENLSEEEIARAVIESLAENTVDAVIASVCWAAVGGAPAVLAHRAINTLDAMVGHHTPRYERFGWASARVDDIVNWVPARVAALAVAIVKPSRGRAIWHAVRHDAPQHPSPNGGVIEAAFAAALGIQLGGTNRYGDELEVRGLLGTGRASQVSDIAEAIALSKRIGVLCALTIPFVSGSLVSFVRRDE
jgi:adenosylcobinamide-phosphate synthase